MWLRNTVPSNPDALESTWLRNTVPSNPDALESMLEGLLSKPTTDLEVDGLNHLYRGGESTLYHILKMKNFAKKTLSIKEPSCTDWRIDGQFRFDTGLSKTLIERQHVDTHSWGKFCYDNTTEPPYSIFMRDPDLNIEYMNLEVNNKLFDFSNYYLNEVCPSFIVVDHSVPLELSNLELLDVVSRGLPQDLNYIPGLIVAIGLGILAISVTLITFSITKNKIITGTVISSILKSILLFFMGFFSLLLQTFSLLLTITSLSVIIIKMNFIEKVLLRWVMSDVHKLQENKQRLVSNLIYILERIQDINLNFKINSDQANNLLHDDEFNKRYNGILKNIHTVRRLFIALSPFYTYFYLFGFNGLEEAACFYDFMHYRVPLLYNENVLDALNEFKVLQSLFKKRDFLLQQKGQFKEIDDNGFILEELYDKFNNS